MNFNFHVYFLGINIVLKRHPTYLKIFVVILNILVINLLMINAYIKNVVKNVLMVLIHLHSVVKSINDVLIVVKVTIAIHHQKLLISLGGYGYFLVWRWLLIVFSIWSDTVVSIHPPVTTIDFTELPVQWTSMGSLLANHVSINIISAIEINKFINQLFSFK